MIIIYYKSITHMATAANNKIYYFQQFSAVQILTITTAIIIQIYNSIHTIK